MLHKQLPVVIQRSKAVAGGAVCARLPHDHPRLGVLQDQIAVLLQHQPEVLVGDQGTVGGHRELAIVEDEVGGGRGRVGLAHRYCVGVGPDFGADDDELPEAVEVQGVHPRGGPDAAAPDWVVDAIAEYKLFFFFFFGPEKKMK